ncbi:MAG: FeoB small GTPase domain-containing protein [Spirulinaceae cyanobacterium]
MTCNDCLQSCRLKRPRKWHRFLSWLSGKTSNPDLSATNKKVALIGSPNVGKSSIFNLLTKTYVTVSNYPGTTVELAQGNAKVAGEILTFYDTPGMYSLIPITEEERVTRDLVLSQKMDLVIHVVDAKHLGRMLNLTLQLIEAKLPVLLVVNMMDEARQLGLRIDENQLAYQLGFPVVLMSAVQKTGLRKLIAEVADRVQPSLLSTSY